jgi:hypothetical protein
MSKDAYLERIHSLPCVICLKRLGVKTYGCEAHHAGDADERNDWAQVALCPEHHRGATGIHGLRRRGFHRMWKTNDVELLAWTNEALHK